MRRDDEDQRRGFVCVWRRSLRVRVSWGDGGATRDATTRRRRRACGNARDVRRLRLRLRRRRQLPRCAATACDGGESDTSCPADCERLRATCGEQRIVPSAGERRCELAPATVRTGGSTRRLQRLRHAIACFGCAQRLRRLCTPPITTRIASALRAVAVCRRARSVVQPTARAIAAAVEARDLPRRLPLTSRRRPTRGTARGRRRREARSAPAPRTGAARPGARAGVEPLARRLDDRERLALVVRLRPASDRSSAPAGRGSRTRRGARSTSVRAISAALSSDRERRKHDDDGAHVRHGGAVPVPLAVESAAVLIVQKYGGTSVGSIERMKNVAARCLATQRKGHQVAVVVSAMSGETNRLLELDAPDPG